LEQTKIERSPIFRFHIAMKIYHRFCSLAALLMVVAPLQAAEVYEFDKAHSAISFKIRHLFSDTAGRFNDFTGKISIDPAKPENGVVDVTIQTTSIDTANARRDEHLRNEDFFNVTKNPTIAFKSKKITKTGEKTAKVLGDLTMNAITKEVTLEVDFLGKGKGKNGQPVTGWSATTELDRTEFGLTYNSMVEGSKVLGDTVKVDIQVEAHGAK